MSQGNLFIAGTWRRGQGPEWIKRNPVDQQQIWRGYEATAENINDAGVAARFALNTWARLPLAQRITVIETFAALLEQNKQYLAEVISRETSKPLWETLTEVQSMIAKVAISIRAYHQRTGETSTPLGDGFASLRHKPHGVLAVFGPYNFPGHLPNGHIIPALIAGNTIIFKPSELTPWTAEETLKFWQQAGLPAGVINLVQGGRTTGEALLQSKHIDGVLFTGSAATGYALHRQLANAPDKMLALEMGGNNALIIHDIGDVDAVVNLTIQSAFISAGQRCTCARRLLVRRGVEGDAFIARLVNVAQQLVVGQWNAEPQPFMGGLISLHAADQVLQAQQDLLNLGGEALLLSQKLEEQSSLLSPGILDLTDVAEVPDQEIFGPITCIYRYDDFEEALRLANNTRFGLSVGLVSQDRALFEQLLIEARAGIVNWNKPLTGASSAAPFGGVGASGNHRASAFYAADYCAWPMASLEAEQVSLPTQLSPGIVL